MKLQAEYERTSALPFYFLILLMWGDHAQLYRATVGCPLYSSHFSQKEPSNYVELMTVLVVDFADIGYKVPLRLYDFVDANVNEICLPTADICISIFRFS